MWLYAVAETADTAAALGETNACQCAGPGCLLLKVSEYDTIEIYSNSILIYCKIFYQCQDKIQDILFVLVLLRLNKLSTTEPYPSPAQLFKSPIFIFFLKLHTQMHRLDCIHLAISSKSLYLISLPVSCPFYNF